MQCGFWRRWRRKPQLDWNSPPENHTILCRVLLVDCLSSAFARTLPGKARGGGARGPVFGADLAGWARRTFAPADVPAGYALPGAERARRTFTPADVPAGYTNGWFVDPAGMSADRKVDPAGGAALTSARRGRPQPNYGLSERGLAMRLLRIKERFVELSGSWNSCQRK